MISRRHVVMVRRLRIIDWRSSNEASTAYHLVCGAFDMAAALIAVVAGTNVFVIRFSPIRTIYAVGLAERGRGAAMLIIVAQRFEKRCREAARQARFFSGKPAGNPDDEALHALALHNAVLTLLQYEGESNLRGAFSYFMQQVLEIISALET